MKNIIFVAVLMALSLSLSANLMWPDAIPIRQGVNIEWFRTGTETEDGGAIYVWSDTKLGERDLFAQKVNASGTMVWGEPLLIDGKPDRQEDPVITRTSDNNYILAWIDFSDDLDGNVYAQKISSSGQLQWATGGVPVCTEFGVQISLNIESDNAGGAYIVWADNRNSSTDLYAQRLNASGTAVWEEDGIPVANGNGDEVQNTMFPDGEGGMMLAYTFTYVGNDDIYAKRFLPDGTMAWAQPMTIASGPGNQSSVRMAPLANGEFVLVWKNQPEVDDNIYAQKINRAGQTLWPNPFVVINDSQTTAAPQLNPRVVTTSDNGVIVAWEDFRLNNQNADLFAQKISAAGVLQWNPAGVLITDADFAQVGIRLAADNAGGAYMVWDDTRNGNAPNYDTFAQHVNSSGTMLWENNGKAICIAENEQSGSLIKVSGNNIFINWMDIRNGSVGIYYQVLNSSGAIQLAANGQQVFWGLSGDTPLQNYLLLPRTDDVVAIWQDTRFANIGYQIYFQIVNADGSLEAGMEVNGRPVTVSVGAEQLTPNAVVTPDGHIGIVWEDKRNPNPKVYAQLISPTGQRLWGDTGLEVTTNSPLRQQSPKISYVDGAFYIGWSGTIQVGTNYVYQTYGQKIQNNQKMWGPDGILISDIGTVPGLSECILSSLNDLYFVWERSNSVGDPKVIYAKRMQPDGTAFPGWDAAGEPTTTYSSWDTIHLHPKSTLTDQGLFVMWRDMRGDFLLNYWGQLFSPNGDKVWDPLGVNLADAAQEQEFGVLSSDHNGVTMVWAENINGMHDIKYSKYNYAGSPIWGDLGNFIVQADSTQINPTIAKFENRGLAVAWADYYHGESDIYYKYLNTDGSLVGSPLGEVLTAAGKFQYDPLLAAVGNEAYAIWADGRSSGKTEILGLYMQKLNNMCSGINDPSAPSLSVYELRQNYPNPFNPETTIMLNVKEANASMELGIYNLKGQLVKLLHNGRLAKGEHSFVWTGTDNNNNSVASGVYFYKVTSEAGNQTRRMLLVK